MNIEAIRKAAEAATPGPYRYSYVEDDEYNENPLVYAPRTTPDGIEFAHTIWEADWATEGDAQLCALLDPATVLELCRLAEIGHCFVHDCPGEAKREKILRLTDEYAIAHGGPRTLEELQQ